MRRILPLLPLLAATLAGSAWAQGAADRLTCFRVNDAAPRAKYQVNVASIGGTQVCTVRTPAKLGCVATAVGTVTPAPPGGGPSGTAVESFLCYQAKCPKPTGNGDAQDQFGTRVVSLRASQLYCTPAFLPPFTPGSATTTTTLAGGGGGQGCQFQNGECTGSCGGGQRCGAVVGTASCACRAVSCGDADAPQCNGACSNSGEACIFNITGCSCVRIP